MSEILYEHWLEVQEYAEAMQRQVEKNLGKWAIKASRQLEFDFREWGPQNPEDTWHEGC